MRRLTVFYESSVLAPYTRRWIESEPKYVPIEFVPVRSLRDGLPAAGLDAASLRDHLTAIDDEGSLWRDGKAELMVLWALRRYRERALRIRHPSRLPFRRANLNWVAGGIGEPWSEGSGHGGGGTTS